MSQAVAHPFLSGLFLVLRGALRALFGFNRPRAAQSATVAAARLACLDNCPPGG